MEFAACAEGYFRRSATRVVVCNMNSSRSHCHSVRFTFSNLMPAKYMQIALLITATDTMAATFFTPVGRCCCLGGGGGDGGGGGSPGVGVGVFRCRV